jgi:Raf kinase inhibitor-like YbhB/YbcL family protein
MPQKLNVADLNLSSPAFPHHERIPDRHSGDGEDVSPELRWSGVPDGTEAFAIIVHDPDAPLVDGFTHWVAYGISGDATGLPEGGGDAVHGTNSFGNAGYNGPAPPPGHGTHHYYFWVYALDEDLDLEPGLVEAHVIEQARMVGTFSH